MCGGEKTNLKRLICLNIKALGRKENCFWAKQEGKRRQVTHRRQVVNSEKEKEKTGGEKGDECYSSSSPGTGREKIWFRLIPRKKGARMEFPRQAFFLLHSSGPHRFFSFYMIHM